jgi:hypothetical protein
VKANARIKSAVVLQDQVTLEPVLLGVCEMNDEYINFKVHLEIENDDFESVVDAIRDHLAEEFQIPASRLSMDRDEMIKRIAYFTEGLRNRTLN